MKLKERNRLLIVIIYMSVLSFLLGMPATILHENFHLWTVKALGGEGRIVYRYLFLEGTTFYWDCVYWECEHYFLIHFAGGIGTGIVFLAVWLVVRKMKDSWIFCPLVIIAIVQLIYGVCEGIFGQTPVLFSVCAGVLGTMSGLFLYRFKIIQYLER